MYIACVQYMHCTLHVAAFYMCDHRGLSGLGYEETLYMYTNTYNYIYVHVSVPYGKLF
jgi:hypothetical protein